MFMNNMVSNSCRKHVHVHCTVSIVTSLITPVIQCACNKGELAIGVLYSSIIIDGLDWVFCKWR